MWDKRVLETRRRKMNMTEIKAAREAEYQAEIAKIDPTDTLAVYWAGSASASVLRDYKAGRVTTVNADRLRRKNNRDVLARAIKKG
jgi:hypothetical protein